MVTRDSRGRSAHIADRAPVVEVRCDDRELLGIEPDWEFNGIVDASEFGGIVDASRPIVSACKRLDPNAAEVDRRRAAHPNHTAMRRCPYRRKKGSSALSVILGPI